MNGSLWIIIILMVMAAVMLLVFRWIDKFINKVKQEPKAAKTPEAAVPETKPEAQAVKEVTEPAVQSIQSTGSLADEIVKTIKEVDKRQIDGYYRRPIERIRPHNRIKKYREAHNYIEYNEDDDDRDTTDTESGGAETVYSAEEYKKMLALLSKPVSQP
jgi:Na+-transporting methylmalonyl-CoA/oxaloacetate decarboxylase gamma subunit